MDSVWILLVSIMLITGILVIVTKYLLRKPPHRAGRLERLQRYLDSRKDMDRNDPRHKKFEDRWTAIFSSSIMMLLTIHLALPTPYNYYTLPSFIVVSVALGIFYWKKKHRLLRDIRPPERVSDD